MNYFIKITRYIIWFILKLIDFIGKVIPILLSLLLIYIIFMYIL